MLYRSLLIYSIGLLLLQSCSYKTYQPIVFSSIDKDSKIVQHKEQYSIYLSSNDKLLNDLELNKKGIGVVESKERVFLHLQQNNEIILLSNRGINLNKVVNFRDLGGYKTKDNRQVVWGKFFRSGHLKDLKASEFSSFEKLHIKTVVDLRTDKEIGKKPDNLPQGTKHIIRQAFEDSEDMFTKTKKDVLKGLITPKQADSLVSVFYSLYTYDRPEVMQSVFADLLLSKEAVLFHCSAGKDRTGMVGAILLTILNVDREVIIEDYLLSNNYRAPQITSLMKLAKVGKIIYPKIDYQVIENFSWIKPIYIRAMFDSIEKKYGSMDNYIRDVLLISDVDRQAYIAKYTLPF